MKMEKDFVIPFIYAQDCRHCELMRAYLEDLCDKYDCILVSYDSESDEALEVGLKHDIDELPGCVIGEIVIKGNNFNKRLLQTAIFQWKQENAL